MTRGGVISGLSKYMPAVARGILNNVPAFLQFSKAIVAAKSRTDVAKVSARRAVQKLVENLPTALGRVFADPLSRQRAILVAGIGSE